MAPIEVTQLDVPFGDGTLHAYDTGGDDARGRAVVWHHGTPNIGSPPAPLFEAASRLGVRWIGYDRPGYGGSTPVLDRTVGSAAACTAAVLDALGIEVAGMFGHSGGGSHALACAALLGPRVTGVVSVSGLAPFGAAGLDWFAGMSPVGEASLRAAAAGRAAKEAYEAAAGDDDPGFVEADWAALQGEWGWFGSVVGPALAAGPGGLIDDDLAYTSPWGCSISSITAPTLVVHGGRDRVVPVAHGEWLAEHLTGAELWRSDDDGHISVLRRAADALTWLGVTT